MTGELISFAAEQQRCFDASTTPEVRKERGHFGTPPAIAKYMAEMFSDIPQGTVRIIDPGAGVGTLSAAVCQRVMKMDTARDLYFELWENDPKLIPILRDTMDRCQKLLRSAGHKMEFMVRNDDFILAHTKKTLFDDPIDPSFNLAILNPPYFKLRKESPQAQAMDHIVHGQPNIYALFASQAESLFRAPVVAALDEYGIPIQVAEKLQAFLLTKDDLDIALKSLKALDLRRVKLQPFEVELVRDAQSAL